MVQSTNASKSKPIHEIRLGRIRAAIWANQTQNGPRHNVTFARLYKDETDGWKDSSSFGRDDLPLVARVSDLALLWIYQKAKEGSDTDAQE